MAAFMQAFMLLLALSTFVLNNHSIVPVIVLLGVMVAVIIVFSILMHRAK
jgi:hypothetical protein